jgi:hypothetical protein
MDAVEYIIEAELLAQLHPNDALSIKFIETYAAEGLQSENTLKAAKALIAKFKK